MSIGFGEGREELSFLLGVAELLVREFMEGLWGAARFGCFTVWDFCVFVCFWIKSRI